MAKRTSGASDKKAAAVRKQQEKAVARRRAKEQKLQKRNERTFAKSLANFQESSFERARAFVDGQLDDNPSWIRPLADLIRDGALQTLLRTTSTSAGAAGAADSGQAGPGRWTGKAKTFEEMPSEAKTFMLLKVGVRVDDGISEDILDSFFAVQFMVHLDTPLPAGARAYETLEKFATERFEALGGHRVAPNVTSQFDKKCFSLDGNTVTNALTGEEASLPPIRDGDKWVLEDEDLPTASVTSEANPHLSFGCRTLFENLRAIDPKAKWVLEKKK